jgi:hypothetical protein
MAIRFILYIVIFVYFPHICILYLQASSNRNSNNMYYNHRFPSLSLERQSRILTKYVSTCKQWTFLFLQYKIQHLNTMHSIHNFTNMFTQALTYVMLRSVIQLN